MTTPPPPTTEPKKTARVSYRLPAVCLADDHLFDRHISPPGHPERPERLTAARQGVMDSAAAPSAESLDARDATLDEMARAHTPEYVDRLSQITGKSGHLDADTFYSPRSFEAARRATGAALALTDALTLGKADYGFALVRPPGHHARPAESMGFCLLNHVAVAARHALTRGARRVVIVDWDVHHGNGTEEIFAQVPEVLYISLHQSPQYPGTGAARDTGVGAGRGFTVNVPLAAGADNAVYRAAFERIVLPIIEQYSPDLTLVSAGYDAHRRDPLGGMQLDGAGYAWMTRGLIETARKGPSHRIGFLLEGGYDLQGMRESVRATLDALIEPEDALPPEGNPEGVHAAEIAAAERAQSAFWRLG
jgi:acetoin utilization deacetylase AcuC-like enzyme